MVVAAETSWTRRVRAATLVGVRMLKLRLAVKRARSAARAVGRRGSTLLVGVTAVSYEFHDGTEGVETARRAGRVGRDPRA